MIDLLIGGWYPYQQMGIQTHRQETSTVTSKGQVVIPSRLRKRLGITRGTRISFIEQGRELVLRAVTDQYISSLKGSLGTRGRALKLLMEDKRKEREL